MIANVITDKAPRNAINMPGEKESNAVLERTGATPHRATTVTSTKNETILISLFIAALL